MTSGQSLPICCWCKHLDYEQDKKWRAPITCTAFPQGIPEAIIDMGYEGLVWDHRHPYRGDQGIQFELLNDFEALKSREVFRNFSSMENLLRLLNKVLKSLERVMHFRDKKQAFGQSDAA